MRTFGALSFDCDHLVITFLSLSFFILFPQLGQIGGFGVFASEIVKKHLSQ
jgi:hypothetical protein